MRIRTPAVAGMFYSGEKKQLTQEIKRCFSGDFGPKRDPPTASSEKIFGVICPHAGYMYSGPIAAQSFYAISNQRFDLAIIVGPNHWGIGENVATMRDGTWQTPLGSVEVDPEAADMAVQSEKIGADFFSHTRDHSLEVQVPMLQYVFRDKIKILPIILNSQDIDTARDVGGKMAEIALQKSTMIIGSSDLTHYESNDFAHSQDSALLEPVRRLDVEGFYSVLRKRNVSACGYGAIASTMVACKKLGAAKGRVVQYATSGDIAGDKSSVVGYGSVVFS